MFTITCLALVAVGATGCLRVRAYQRELLSTRPMQNGAESAEDRFRQHWQGAREGSFGGFGAAGGGCGCN